MIPVNGNELFEIFKLRNRNFQFQRSSSGSSGFTFLPKNIDYPWVVKWQNPIQAEIEFICTEFYRRTFTHLSVPRIIHHVSDTDRKTMYKYFKTQGIAIEHVPILIEYKTGSNLKQLFENQNVNFESINEMSHFFSIFGEIGGYDFLIANCDRFIPEEIREQLDDNFSANGGNVLIELLDEQVSEDGIKITHKNTHLIDNAPHFLSFFDYGERNPKRNEADDDLHSGMRTLGFNEESDEAALEESSPPVRSETARSETACSETACSETACSETACSETACSETASSETASSETVRSGTTVVSGDDLRQRRKNQFQEFLTASSFTLVSIAKQIKIGIQNEWIGNYPDSKDHILEYFNKNIDFIEENIFQGLLTAQNRLKNPQSILSIMDEIKNENQNLLPTTLKVANFISENLIFSKNFVENDLIEIGKMVNRINAILESMSQSSGVNTIIISPSKVAANNKYRRVLGALREDLINFNGEKRDRIISYLSDFMENQDPVDQDVREILQGILEIVEYYKITKKIPRSPEKPKQLSPMHRKPKMARVLFDESKA